MADFPNNSNEGQAPPPADEEKQPEILTPVSADDHQRARNRVRNRRLMVGVAVILVAAWFYKHYTDPIHAQEAFEAGDRLLRSGRYEQAILFFDQALGYDPDYADAYQLRGRAIMALFRPKEAIRDFARYVELRPRDPAGYIDLGRAHLGAEEFGAVLEDAMLAVQNGPDVGAAYQLRGIALRRAGKLTEALEDFNRAVSLAPEMANYYERGATYQELGQHERAIEDFTEVITFDGLNAQAFHARAGSYRALGEIEQAERDHRQGRRLDGR